MYLLEFSAYHMRIFLCDFCALKIVSKKIIFNYFIFFIFYVI